MQVFANVTQYNTSNSGLLRIQSNRMEADNKSNVSEVSVTSAAPFVSPKTTYPHSLKDFLQDFSIYDKNFQVTNEFNQLNLLDDICHVKNFERCSFQEPHLDR